MSLVTRCPACATAFKVVRDQLRISDGWVRCGRCSQVFDATQSLQSTGEDEAAVSLSAPAPSFADSASAPVRTPPASPAPETEAALSTGAAAASPGASPPLDTGTAPPDDGLVDPDARPEPAAPPLPWPAAGLLDLGV